MSNSIYENLNQLGSSTKAPTTPEEAVLERVANPRKGTDYLVRFTVPEFTSLCPVTGQPDFAHLVLDYVPADFLVESKSLKLYMQSFRNHAAFHEDCTVGIAQRLVDTRAIEQACAKHGDPAQEGGEMHRLEIDLQDCQRGNAMRHPARESYAGKGRILQPTHAGPIAFAGFVQAQYCQDRQAFGQGGQSGVWISHPVVIRI